MRSSSFHNTTELQGQELASAERSARTQEDIILEFMKAREGQLFTPFDVLIGAFPTGSNIPITSIRRALSNLSAQGQPLTKTDIMRTGDYGKPCHTWAFYRPIPCDFNGRLF